MANMFNEDGTYNKTEWKAGDKITAVKLNKIESSLEAINNNDIDRHVEADSRLDILEERMANTPDNEQMNALEDMVKDNKDVVNLALYSINQNVKSLESEVEEFERELNDVYADIDSNKNDIKSLITTSQTVIGGVNELKTDKETKKTLYIRDYATTNDITTIISEVLSICKDNQFNLDLTGEWTLSSSVTIDFPITIRNGSIFIPSHESDGTSNLYTFVITSDNVIFDNVSIESNNDKIPQLNIRNNEMVGLASNVYFISATDVENIKVINCIVNKMSGGTFTRCKNITFDNCSLKMNEMSVYAYRCRDFKFINSSIESSTEVGSIYYHGFYMIENEDVNLSRLFITTSDDNYTINDIFHFFNPSSTAVASGSQIIVSDINVIGNFNRLAQINLHNNIIFSNIQGVFNSHIIMLNRGSQNISLNNCCFTINRKLKTTALVCSTDFDSNNSCIVNSTKFNILDFEGGGVLDTCNVTYNNCEITTSMTLPVAKSLNAGYVGCNQCVFKTPQNITDMFNGTDGEYNYYSCIFECVNTAQYISYNFSEQIKMRIINCFFTISKKLFDMSITNQNTVVYNCNGYYNGVSVEYKYLGKQTS